MSRWTSWRSASSASSSLRKSSQVARHFGNGFRAATVRERDDAGEILIAATLLCITGARLPPPQQLKLFERTGPVRAHQSRKAAVGQHSSAGLALRAVIGFV